jgi:energy-coupling factor transport system ATP-binding protein
MLEARDVFYAYPREVEPAVLHVSMQVALGEIVGIVGPNGSGKSTLGRLLKGLLVPASGHVCIDGLDTSVDSLEARRRVGLVFQNPNSQIVNAVVENEVAFGPENLGLSTAEIRERVEDALRTVGLSGQEASECHRLSMAGKQRVALAAVLAMQPRYLILDEPTAWLEPIARWQLLTTVMEWALHRGAGLVLVTHRMDEAQICARIYGMLDGRVEISGTLSEVLQNEPVRRRLSLAVPDTFVLADELRAAGVPVGDGASLDVMAEALCRS